MQERLQKIIARAGIASRRHAEDLIRSGQVRVNGVVVTELGAKADPEHDRVEAAGKVAQVSSAHVYLLMNKPPDVVSTLADPEGRRTLRNYLVGVSERVFPVGRLDYAASGAIFLTNDGDFASKMLKASPGLPQSFWLKVKGRVNDTQLKTLSHTVDGKIFPLRGTHAAGKNPLNPWYEAQIAGGRREILRRALLAIGHPVEKIRRIKLASLDVDTVQEGHYRQLDAEEVAKLARAVDRALTENKQIPKPRREWRPRAEVLSQKPDGGRKPAAMRPAFVESRLEAGGSRQDAAGGSIASIRDRNASGDKRHASGNEKYKPSNKWRGSGNKRNQSASGRHATGDKRHDSGGKRFGQGNRRHGSGADEYRSDSRSERTSKFRPGMGEKRPGMPGKKSGMRGKPGSRGNKGPQRGGDRPTPRYRG